MKLTEDNIAAIERFIQAYFETDNRNDMARLYGYGNPAHLSSVMTAFRRLGIAVPKRKPGIANLKEQLLAFHQWRRDMGLLKSKSTLLPKDADGAPKEVA